MRTTGQVASALGTSVPRVHRAIHGLGLHPEQTPGGHLRLNGEELRQLASELGSVPTIEGLRRQDVLVLAALNRRPFGLVSARAVARASGISPTTASVALRRLEAVSYIEHVTEQVIEGRVRKITIWKVRRTSPQWKSVAPIVARIVLPQPAPVGPAPRYLPRRFAHLFWDMPHPERIDLQRQGPTVAYRIMTSNDAQAISWASKTLSRSALRKAMRFRGVDAPTRAMIENILR